MPTQLPDLAKPLKAAGFKGNPADLANVTAPPLSAVSSCRSIGAVTMILSSASTPYPVRR